MENQKTQNFRKTEAYHERRKSIQNSVKRKALLTIFNSKEISATATTTTKRALFEKKSVYYSDIFTIGRKENVCIDLMLNHIPSEVLTPTRDQENERENLRFRYLQLLQHEINHLKEKFELNNRKYQIEDLMRFTDNSKKILNIEAMEKYSDFDQKLGESAYHGLECARMQLEQKLGFRNFLQVYGKMVNIINDEFECNLKTFLENQADGPDTFNKTMSFAGDNDDVIRNTWKSIISILGDEQQYLPDVWELVMSENIYYHL